MASSIVLTSTLAIIFAFFVPIIIVAAKQIEALIDVLPQKLVMLQNFVLNYKLYGHKLPEFVDFHSLVGNGEHVATGIVNQSITITVGFAQGIIFLLAICMIVFYLMVDKDTIRDYFIKVFPPKMRDKAELITDTISQKVGGYVVAQILGMVAVGFMTAIILAILKVDYSLLLGLITGVLDIIPIIGPTIALALCLVIAYPLGLLWLVLVLVGFVAAQWIANNFVKPVVFSKFLNLHPLVIIFALLVAAQFLGLWGALIAPAIAAMLYVLFDELYLKEIEKKK
jgi:predicted PurR-regulated permease PerM